MKRGRQGGSGWLQLLLLSLHCAPSAPPAPPHFTLHARRCGATDGPAAAAVAAELTLPRHREATADERKRSAVIYAEALRQALSPEPLPPARGAGRR